MAKSQRFDPETENYAIAPTAHSLRADGFDASEDGTGRGTPLIPIHCDAVRGNSLALTPSPDAEGRVRLRNPGIGIGVDGDPSFTLAATGVHAIAFSCKDHGADAGAIAPTLRSMGHDGSHANAGGQVAVMTNWAVRRLTPTECERLQGFPDNYTNVPWRGKASTPDGPRYKALGNSMACNCMRWIGRRIDLVNSHPSLGTCR